MKTIVETTGHTITTPDGRQETFDSKKVIQIDTSKNPFYLTFLNFVKWMYDIKGNAPFKVLIHMMNIAEFNSGRVHLSMGERQIMMRTLGISEVSMYAAIKQLAECGAIKRVFHVDKSTGEQLELKGEYIVNPEMFWKGDLSKRKHLTITFQSDPVDDDAINEAKLKDDKK